MSTQTTDTLKKQIVEIIVKTINDSKKPGTPDISTNDVEKATSLKELNLDSLTAFELICYFEDEFSIEIPTEDAEQVMSLDSAVGYIQNKLNPPA